MSAFPAARRAIVFLFGRRATPLALLALLAACDDGTVITRVRQWPAFARSQIVAMGSDGGIPTEIHGRPFPAADPAEIAGLLRLPAGWPQEFGFRAIRPGPRGTHARRRLVLVFNPAEPPQGPLNCRRAYEAPTHAPREAGFEVTATFCDGEKMLATGHMEARRTREDDPQEFARVMRLLLQVTMQEERPADR